MSDTKKDWGWYIGKSDEVYTSGPETYENAVQIARDEYGGAYICEAYKAPKQLSSMFDVHDWLERCEDQVWDECVGENGDALFHMKKEKRQSLQATVRAAIDEWQFQNGLTFMPFMFTECRNHEYIDAPEEGE